MQLLASLEGGETSSTATAKRNHGISTELPLRSQAAMPTGAAQANVIPAMM